jgi:hypothetical protein
MAMQRAVAYAFASHLTLAEMLDRLNALGKHEWIMGDSYWYGDYLKVWPYRGPGDRVRLRIYEDENQSPFVLEVIFESEAPTAAAAWRECDDYVRRDVLPAVDARDITPTSTID